MSKPMPNKQQLAALITWARDHGRHWKADLDVAWMKAGTGVLGYNPLLQQVRNEFGPTWLTNVKLADLARHWASLEAPAPVFYPPKLAPGEISREDCNHCSGVSDKPCPKHDPKETT